MLEDVPATVSVDISAVQYIDDKPYVFVKTSSGFEKRAVELGFSNNDKVEILSGLASGEEVPSLQAKLLEQVLTRGEIILG